MLIGRQVSRLYIGNLNHCVSHSIFVLDHSFAKFNRFPRDSDAAAHSVAGVGVVLNTKTAASTSQLFAMEPRGSCKVSSRRSGGCHLFIVLAYAFIFCSSDVVRGISLNLFNLLRKIIRTDILVPSNCQF